MSSIKLKRFINIYTGNSISDGDKDQYTIQNDNTIPYISTKDIEIGSNKVNYYNDMYIDISKNSKFKIADKNNILLCIEGGSAGKKIAQVNQKVCFVNKLCCFNPSIEYNQKFVYFYLQSDLFLSQFNLNLTGLIGGVSQSIIKEFKIPFYSMDLQIKISNYLDNKVSKIDQTIEDNKKEIELLEEYKKNYYNEMLNILNKTAIKNVVIDVKDGTHATISRTDEGEHLLSSKNIQNSKLYIGENESMISVDDYNSIVKNGYPQKNDILFCSVGTVGKTCIYNYDKPMAFQRSVSFLRTNEKMLPKFLYYNTKTIFFEDDLLKNVNKALQDGIYINQIKNLKVSYCNIEKQKKFIHLLDTKTDKLNKVISYRKLIITKLKEYKKSLIYEVVTGKIEV